MTKEEIIRNLKYTMEKHKNDTVNTFKTNISVMCKDILDYLEQEPILDKIRAEIEKLRPNLRPEQMTDYDYAMVAVVNDIVAIIDKYRTESDIEKRKECPHKPCINHEDGCEEWAGCPCVYYKAESEED